MPLPAAHASFPGTDVISSRLPNVAGPLVRARGISLCSGLRPPVRPGPVCRSRARCLARQGHVTAADPIARG